MMKKHLSRRSFIELFARYAAMATTIIYFPIIARSKTLPSLGAQQDGSFVNLMPFVVPDRVYHMPVRWIDCCALRHTFSVPNYILDNVTLLGNNPIGLGLFTCPFWARAWTNYPGSPPLREYWGDFADYVRQLLDLFCTQTVYIELWNEPDVDRDDISLNDQNYMGTWVRNHDYIEGGLLYGEFVATVSQIIKASYPDILIFGGASVSDGDNSYRFVRAAAQTGLSVADRLSYHVYLRPPVYNFDTIAQVGQLFRQIIDLPQAVTETSIRDNYQEIDLPAFERAKADYMQYLIEHQEEWGIYPINIYGMANGWQHTDLTRSGNALPMWYVWSGDT